MKMPSFRLDGKRALVTGASKGIGFAAAFVLAKAGADVTIAARQQAGLSEAVRQLAAEGLKVHAVAVDVTDSAAVQTVVQSLGPVNVLVNNAGGNRSGLLKDMSAEDIDFVLALNVTSSMVVSKAVIEGLINAGESGSIINLSSQFGYVGAAERVLYSAAKHGVEGYTKSLAWEVGRHGIRVNAIAPSMIETDMTRARLAEPGVRENFAAKTAIGRIGQPDDLMGAILFLASDASSFVTGTSLRVDGGTTAV